MEQVELAAQVREEIGGGRPRRLRREGLIPAVLYGGKDGNIVLSVDREYLEKKAGPLHENQVLQLRIEGAKKEKNRPVIVKEIQMDHLAGIILHIDFQSIALDEKLTATVPVVEVGEAIGATRDGGILEHVHREIEIRCLPTQIPENIEVDVSSLEIGGSIRVGEIELEEGVEILTDPEVSLFIVSAPITEEEEKAAEEEEEAAEAEGEEEKKEEGAAGEKEGAEKEKGAEEKEKQG